MQQDSLFPIYLKLRNKTCLIVGGGMVAYRKCVSLMETGVNIRIVSPKVCSQLQTLIRLPNVDWHPRKFHIEDLSNIKLVYAATNDSIVNKNVYKESNRRSIPVNIVDNPGLCSFYSPAIIRRGPIQIAISTSGSAPMLARILRSRIECLIPDNFGTLARFANRIRHQVKAEITSIKKRERFWQKFFSSDELFRLSNENQSLADEKASELIQATIELRNAPEKQKGEVFLIGAGPGDPELLTLKALRILQEADIIIFDRLVNREILKYARRDSEKIYVGKKSGHHTLSQKAIEELITKHALNGSKVARLKGGDPGIFGRVGEEFTTIKESGIPVSIIPGITAASGCAAYSGIPLTHRSYAQSVKFVTGHLQGNPESFNWDGMVIEGQTLSIYMGLENLPALVEGLILRGMTPTMPSALIQDGTSSNAKVKTAPLTDLVDLAKSENFKSPTMIIIGKVVSLINTDEISKLQSEDKITNSSNFPWWLIQEKTQG